MQSNHKEVNSSNSIGTRNTNANSDTDNDQNNVKTSTGDQTHPITGNTKRAITEMGLCFELQKAKRKKLFTT